MERADQLGNEKLIITGGADQQQAAVFCVTAGVQRTGISAAIVPCHQNSSVKMQVALQNVGLFHPCVLVRGLVRP